MQAQKTDEEEQSINKKHAKKIPKLQSSLKYEVWSTVFVKVSIYNACLLIYYDVSPCQFPGIGEYLCPKFFKF